MLAHRRCAVAPHTPIRQVAHVLAETGLAAAPVVGATGAVLDTVTPLDIVRAQDGGPRAGRHSAAEVMSRHPVTVDADTPVDRAAHLLTASRTTHLVVLDPAGAVVGVLGRRDLLLPLCRPDNEIEADAAARVGEIVPTTGGSVRVHVRDGIVHLTGKLTGQSDGARGPQRAAGHPRRDRRARRAAVSGRDHRRPAPLTTRPPPRPRGDRQVLRRGS